MDRDKWVENNCIRMVRSRSVIWLGRVRSGVHEGVEKYRPNIRKPEGRTWLGGLGRRLKVNIKVQAEHTRVGTLIVATIYLQLIQNRYMFRSFTVLQCSHQHCVQPFASYVEVVGCL